MNPQEVQTDDTAARGETETQEPGPEGISSTGTTEVLPDAAASDTTAATEGTAGDAGAGTTTRG